MDIMELGTQLLSEQLGVDENGASIGEALAGLLGDGQNVDLVGLVNKIGANGDLGKVLSSWLGDGSNEPISADSILGLLGESNVDEFAQKLGADSGSAASGLAEVLPQLIDKASSGGSLMESVGGIDGLMGAAKSLFS